MKCALVTGGSRGIGKAVALKLANELGYHIIFTYRSNTAAAEETKKEVEKVGVHCWALAFDVSDAEATKNAIKNWETEYPEASIEVLVNNAGIHKDNLFMWMPEEDWHSVMDTNLGGFFTVTQALIHPMLKKRYGRVINMVSLSGVKGNPGQTNYSASKAAIIGATKSLAQEIAKRKVTVNAVAPGFIASEMTQDLPEKELKKLIPANRFGQPEEVADLVCFLASEKSAYITGEVIHINGGIYT